jgi:hypothetical protein
VGSPITSKIYRFGSVAEVVALLYSHVNFLCGPFESESQEMVKVQLHQLHNLRLRLVYRGVCDQTLRGLWVLVVVILVLGLAPDVGVIEQPVKPWFDVMKVGEFFDA